MQTLEALRHRIENVEDMRSVVTTMKTLAAVSIRQYESAVEALVDYDRTLQLAFQILLREHDLQPGHPGEENLATAAVVFGSDQGMCGQFNDEIAGFTTSHMARNDQDQWPLLTIGARVQSRLLDAGHSVDENFALPVSVADITRLVQDLLPRIEQWRSEQNIARLFVFYNEKTSAASYQPRRIQLLPISRQLLTEWKHKRWQSPSLPLHTMPWRDLFSAVVRQYLFVSLFRACAESLASENASRIASMQAAEKNIEERLSELQTRFHQQRQTSITEELLDVVTGFEALAQKKNRRPGRDSRP